MARRRTANAVSLFPFLAVLVCTMGALILLLLVTTRQIRQQQTQELMAQAAPPAEKPQPPVQVEIQIRADANEEELKQLRLTAGELQQQISALAVNIAQRQLELQLLLDLQNDQKSQLANINQELQQVQTIASLQDSSSAQSDLDKARQELMATQQQIEELQAETVTLTRQISVRQRDMEEVDRTTKQAELLLVSRESALISLRQIVDESSAAAASGSTGAVIQFSNSSGTSRRPIIIDVSDKGFNFLPADVRVTTQDMQGFRSGDNPLLAGVFAVHAERSRTNQSDAPYVLLLVRPSGCTQFYMAQRALKDVDVHFGYELINEDQTIAAGTGSGDEVRVLRESLLACLTRREQLYGSLIRSGVPMPGPVPSRSFTASEPADSTTRILNNRILPGSSHDGRYYVGGPPPATRFSPPRSNLEPPANWPDNTATAQNDLPGRSDRTPLAMSSSDADAVRSSEPTAGAATSHDTVVADDASEQTTPVQPFDDFGEFWNNLETLDPSPADETRVAQTPDTEVNRAQQPSDWPARKPAFNWQESHSVGTARAESQSVVPDSENLVYSPNWRDKPAEEGSLPDTSQFGLVGGQNYANQATTMTEAEFRQFANLLNQQPTAAGSLQEVTVYLDQNHLTVAQQASIEINNASADELFVRLLAGLKEEMKYSPAPDSVAVQPVVRFVVSPGAERHRAALALRLNQLQVQSSSSVFLDAHVDQQRGRVVYSSPESPAAGPAPRSKSGSMPVIRPRRPEERRRIQL